MCPEGIHKGPSLNMVSPKVVKLHRQLITFRLEFEEGRKWPHLKTFPESHTSFEIVAEYGLDDHVSNSKTFLFPSCPNILLSFLFTRPFDLPNIDYSSGEYIADTASPTTIEPGSLTVSFLPTSKGMWLIHFDIPTSYS